MKRAGLVLLAACSSAATEPDEAQVLRVGSHIGLARMEPTVSGTTTRQLVELVYRPLSEYFVSAKAVGDEVHLGTRPNVSSVATVAGSLRHPHLVSAVVHGSVVIAKFDSPEAAHEISLDLPLVELGPFRVVETNAERLVLSRKTPDDEGAETIEVTAVSSEDEEWRRLIAGEFDLLPQVLPGTARQLAAFSSLHIVPVEFPQRVAIWFNVTSKRTADVRLRRAIALAVRRVPLAVSVTADGKLASAEPEDWAEARRYLEELGVTDKLPMRLVMIVPAAESEFLRAALVLQQQLAVLHILLDVDALELSELGGRIVARDFDLMLFYGNTSKRSWDYLRSGSPSNFVGYASKEFDAAAGEGDEARALAILNADVPFTPLFFVSESVVVRRNLCQVHPKYSFDLSWIGEVRACQLGEED